MSLHVRIRGNNMPYQNTLEPEDRFTFVWDCLLGTPRNSEEFRSQLMKAYNLDVSHLSQDPLPAELSPTQLATRELAFAESILRGDPVDEGKLVMVKKETASLRSVILKELGTLRDPNAKGTEYPWLGGDWITMAEIVKINAEWQLQKLTNTIKDTFRDKGISPSESICVWPVAEWGADLPNQDHFRMKAAKLGLEVHKEYLEEEMAFQRSESNFEQFYWIVLSKPPKKLQIITADQPPGISGVPENLWSGLKVSPGDKAN
tara:strand:+ start:106 stop:888 length:783 start_codon:yes stop_codon:yes gene_type:complete